MGARIRADGADPDRATGRDESVPAAQKPRGQHEVLIAVPRSSCKLGMLSQAVAPSGAEGPIDRGRHVTAITQIRPLRRGLIQAISLPLSANRGHRRARSGACPRPDLLVFTSARLGAVVSGPLWRGTVRGTGRLIIPARREPSVRLSVPSVQPVRPQRGTVSLVMRRRSDSCCLLRPAYRRVVVDVVLGSTQPGSHRLLEWSSASPERFLSRSRRGPRL